MTARDPSGEYREIREALRERGYLETPLERLFLRQLGDPYGRSLRARLRAAFLTGALAGPLLGVLLAAVVLIETRGAVRVWPDGVLYALLFGIVLGVFVALVEAAAGFAIRIGGRVPARLSARKASLAAGLGVSAAFALYLGVWWFRAGGEIRAADIAALIALALGAGFAGRVVSAATLIQAAVASGRAPQRPRPRMTALLILAAVAAAGVAALAAAALAIPSSAGEPVHQRAGAPRRAILLAWDGLSAELYRGLRRTDPEGGVDFARLSRLTSTPLGTPAGVDPVAVWTTVATGTPPSVHGVGGVELQSLIGAVSPVPQRAGVAAAPLTILGRLWPTRQRPARAGVRRTPTFWEIAADARKTAVIGWWATWPAGSPGRAGGYLVSDGALAALRSGRGVEASIYPSSWGAARAPEWLRDAERDSRSVSEVMGAAGEFLREPLTTDLFALRALDAALADPEVGAAAVYLPGLDILRERCRKNECDLFEVLEAARAHCLAVLRRLPPALTGSTGDELLLVVALPGRVGVGEHGFLLSTRPGSDQAEPVGGRATRQNQALPLTSIAPTWLSAAGFTVDDRMTGSVAAWAIPAGGVAERRRTRVTPASVPPPAAALEEDVTERLRSLGYVQ